jgi:uncharacterized membrane-anchored protein YitT (DUF2179 family)
MNKKPWLAALLNIILNGLGYLYVGKRKVFGTLLLISQIIIYLWMYTDPSILDTWYTWVYIIGFLWTLALAIDAYNDAKTTVSVTPTP